MSKVTIRAAEERDRDAIIELIHALNLHEAALSADRRTDFAAAKECYASILSRIARDGGALIVAQVEEEPVGVLSLTFATDEPYVREELRRFGVVTDLVVAESRRGTGIGRSLIADAERRTRERGLSRLMIGVLQVNERAHSAYRSAGFKPHFVSLIKNV